MTRAEHLPDDTRAFPLDRAFVLRSLAIIGVAVATRLFFVIFSPFWAGDSPGYDAIARNLLGGQGFALVPESPTVFRPPVYPLFIASVYAIGGGPWSVLVAQAFVGAAGVWVLYLLARKTFDERVSTVGALFAGAYPHLAWYSATFLSETISFFLLACALLASARLRLERIAPVPAIIAGALFALSALATPRLAILPLGAGAAMLLRRVSVRHVLATLTVMFVGYAAVLTPWVVRNFATFGVPVPLVVGMQGLVYWLPADRVGLYDYRFDVWAREEPLVARWLELYSTPGLAFERTTLPERIALEAQFFEDAARKISDDPGGYLRHQLGVVPFLWIQPAAYAGHFRDPLTSQNDGLGTMIAKGNWAAAGARAISTVVFTVGLFGGVLLGLWQLRSRWREIGLLLVPTAQVVLFQTFAYVEHRFSVLAHPFLWPIAVYGWLTILRAVRRETARQEGAPL